MSKIFKRLLGIAAVGGAVAAGVIYYLNKSEKNDDDFLDEFDDDFDLDDDLNPAEKREYVSLNTAPNADSEETEAETETDESKAEAKEASKTRSKSKKADDAKTDDTKTE